MFLFILFIDNPKCKECLRTRFPLVSYDISFIPENKLDLDFLHQCFYSREPTIPGVPKKKIETFD